MVAAVISARGQTAEIPKKERFIFLETENLGIGFLPLSSCLLASNSISKPHSQPRRFFSAQLGARTTICWKTFCLDDLRLQDDAPSTDVPSPRAAIFSHAHEQHDGGRHGCGSDGLLVVGSDRFGRRPQR
jgi:hypothetical protein